MSNYLFSSWAITAPKSAVLRKIEIPKLGSKEVLIRVRCCGICMLDMKYYSGVLEGEYADHPGHEADGVVEEIGSEVAEVGVGDNVAVIGIGGFSTYMVAEENSCARLPQKIDDWAAYITEPLVCTLQFNDHYRAQYGDNLALFGCGYMGLLLLQGLGRKRYRDIYAIDSRNNVLDLARKLGATRTINIRESDPVEKILTAHPEGIEQVVEACGVPQVFDSMLRILKPDGSFGLFGEEPSDTTLRVPLLKEKRPRIFTSSNLNRLGLNREAARLLANGAVDQKSLITHRFPFDKLDTALEAAHHRQDDWIKGVVQMRNPGTQD